jgi:hypothetical protein
MSVAISIPAWCLQSECYAPLSELTSNRQTIEMAFC